MLVVRHVERDHLLEATKMRKLIRRLWREETGQDLTEYALLMVLIALSSIVAMQGLAQAISNVYGNSASNLSTAT